MSLSNKWGLSHKITDNTEVIKVSDVREAVKELKANIIKGFDTEKQLWLQTRSKNGIFDIIDEIFGETLI